MTDPFFYRSGSGSRLGYFLMLKFYNKHRKYLNYNSWLWYFWTQILILIYFTKFCNIKQKTCFLLLCWIRIRIHLVKIGLGSGSINLPPLFTYSNATEFCQKILRCMDFCRTMISLLWQFPYLYYLSVFQNV